MFEAVMGEQLIVREYVRDSRKVYMCEMEFEGSTGQAQYDW